MLVHEQQKRIDALEAEHHPANVEALESSSTATPFASAAVSDAHMTAPTVVVSSSPTGSSTPQGTPTPQTVQAGSTDERVRNLERQIKGIGPISFSGDMRLRAEPFFGGPVRMSRSIVSRGRIPMRFETRMRISARSLGPGSL